MEDTIEELDFNTMLEELNQKPTSSKKSLQMESTKLHTLSDDLSPIFKKMSKSKKVMVLTGAGISCNAGIPDFRSSDGLYNVNTTGSRQIKGKDLFDISLFNTHETISDFAIFMSTLYSEIERANPTRTHQFIADLSNQDKLVRCYTQNIDGLEAKLGLKMNFEQNKEKTLLQNWKSLDVVQLHGDLNSLSCTSCYKAFNWSKENYSTLSAGELPDCPQCIAKRDERIELGKRATGSLGRLRPNIVLYGENHPFSEIITTGLNSDLKSRPDLFIIMGTSLKVHGVKQLVKSMSQAVHSKNGIVIMINKDIIPGWNGIIDYQVQSDCDEFIINFESFKKSHPQQVLQTPPSTPKKICRIRDLLNTPSPQKKRKFSIFQQEQTQFSSNLTPEESPKKSPRKALKSWNFGLDQQDNKKNLSKSNSRSSLHDYSDLRRSPRISRIVNLLNED